MKYAQRGNKHAIFWRTSERAGGQPFQPSIRPRIYHIHRPRGGRGAVTWLGKAPEPVGEDLSNISLPYVIAEHHFSNMDLVPLPSGSDWSVTQVHLLATHPTRVCSLAEEAGPRGRPLCTLNLAHEPLGAIIFAQACRSPSLTFGRTAAQVPSPRSRR